MDDCQPEKIKLVLNRKWDLKKAGQREYLVATFNPQIFQVPNCFIMLEISLMDQFLLIPPQIQQESIDTSGAINNISFTTAKTKVPKNECQQLVTQMTKLKKQVMLCQRFEKNVKSEPSAEPVILSTCQEMIRIMLRELAASDVNKISLSNKAISRRIAYKPRNIQLTLNHLDSLLADLSKYFPSIPVIEKDWTFQGQIIMADEDELTSVARNRTLMFKHCELNLEAFWILFEHEYLCEHGFSANRTIKRKNRERLLSLEDELRVCLSKIQP
ncbi:hypothetical protein RF11_03136 [Thelohanellus kitauei]|uniref:Uncharacterized protein n=1 Tax=Thelohanellus kitauei TaxID=669202 RepID=A0A0C2JB23_THEKT|nr:hypothetical protein RF11_00099 [Thelohanellus kitauei]KII75064.1 hypothetical protein RF11_03136 [Thelohanellus kitauei]